MQVNKIGDVYNRQQNPTFASVRLGTTNLFKIKNGKKIGYEQAFITMLDDKDPSDVLVVEKLKQLWVKKSAKIPGNDAYLIERETEGLCDNFIKLHKTDPKEHYSSLFPDEFSHKRVFLVIEQPGRKPLEKRILGFTKVRDHHDNSSLMEWAYLVVNPEVSAYNKKRKIGGIGEVLFAKALQIGKENGFEKVTWVSDNNPYYAHILSQSKCFTKIEEIYKRTFNIFTLSKQHIEKFLVYFDNKYGTTFSSSNLEKDIPRFH